jgi:hypothetical protein
MTSPQHPDPVRRALAPPNPLTSWALRRTGFVFSDSSPRGAPAHAHPPQESRDREEAVETAPSAQTSVRIGFVFSNPQSPARHPIWVRFFKSAPISSEPSQEPRLPKTGFFPAKALEPPNHEPESPRDPLAPPEQAPLLASSASLTPGSPSPEGTSAPPEPSLLKSKIQPPNRTSGMHVQELPSAT